MYLSVCLKEHVGLRYCGNIINIVSIAIAWKTEVRTVFRDSIFGTQVEFEKARRLVNHDTIFIFG